MRVRELNQRVQDIRREQSYQRVRFGRSIGEMTA
jgi:hypothetical protein